MKINRNIICPHCDTPLFGDQYRSVNVEGTIILSPTYKAYEWCKEKCRNCEQDIYYHVVTEVFYIAEKAPILCDEPLTSNPLAAEKKDG